MSQGPVEIPSRGMTDALAARVTALEQGTGWRDISGLLDPAVWTLSSVSGMLRIRRVGSEVTVVGRLQPVAPLAVAGRAPVLTLPAGFAGIGYLPGPSFGNAATRYWPSTEAFPNRLDVAAGTAIATSYAVAFMWTFPTNDAFPSVLPGTAV